MSGNYDYIWKIAVGGQGGVGKTTLLHRYIHNEFIEDTKLTIGVQMHTQSLIRQDRRINLVIWDLGGQERFRFIQGNYMKGSAGAFVMFDMSRYSTFSQIKEWVDMLRKQCSSSIPIVLVGTKMDLVTDPDELASVHQSALELVDELGLSCYSPTSSKTNTNIYETIHYLIDLLILWAYQSESGVGVIETGQY
ncbi:MAG: Rab family GTPase [Candidatus Hodarchaeota archaeon]